MVILWGYGVCLCDGEVWWFLVVFLIFGGFVFYGGCL